MSRLLGDLNIKLFNKLAASAEFLDSKFMHLIIACTVATILQLSFKMTGLSVQVLIAFLASILFGVLTYYFHFYFSKFVSKNLLKSFFNGNSDEQKLFYLLVDFLTVFGVFAIPYYFVEVHLAGFNVILAKSYPLHLSLVVLFIIFGFRRGIRSGWN